MANQTTDLLRTLAEEYDLRDAAKLFQLARRQRVPGASIEAARAALKNDAARQIFRQRLRSEGKSFAEDIGKRLQADLVDLGRNAKSERDNKFILTVVDVFSRETETRPLKTKTAPEVAAALKDAVDDLEPQGSYQISTDRGQEWASLKQALPGAIHREKNSTNDIAIVDRTIQTLKKNLATRVARRGGAWDSHIEAVTDAYNKAPHSAVYGAPEDVKDSDTQKFLLYRDNADKFMENEVLYNRLESTLLRAGGFRIPTTTGRSFEPRFSDKIYRVNRILPGRLYVEDTEGGRHLLKRVQPVDPESGQAIGQLVEPRLGRRAAFQRFADALAAELQARGSMRVDEAAALPALRGLRMRIRTFLRLFSDTFKVTNTRVSLNKDVAPLGRDLEAEEVAAFARANPFEE